jgi:Xaa-Pro aminopeptidase
MIRTALAAAGLKDSDGLVLFGGNSLSTFGYIKQALISPSTENASLPHGSGTDRILTSNDLILFDIGGSLHGYYSDLTRTFALRGSHIPTQALEKWFLVQAAQQAAARAAKAGALASDVDAAARKVIEGKGLGKWFTHRLGHGK